MEANIGGKKSSQVGGKHQRPSKPQEPESPPRLGVNSKPREPESPPRLGVNTRQNVLPDWRQTPEAREAYQLRGKQQTPESPREAESPPRLGVNTRQNILPEGPPRLELNTRNQMTLQSKIVLSTPTKRTRSSSKDDDDGNNDMMIKRSCDDDDDDNDDNEVLQPSQKVAKLEVEVDKNARIRTEGSRNSCADAPSPVGTTRTLSKATTVHTMNGDHTPAEKKFQRGAIAGSTSFNSRGVSSKTKSISQYFTKQKPNNSDSVPNLKPNNILPHFKGNTGSHKLKTTLFFSQPWVLQTPNLEAAPHSGSGSDKEKSSEVPSKILDNLFYVLTNYYQCYDTLRSQDLR